jgi:hypothetical protein
MRQSDLARYGLWCGIVVTAEGNRREYHMATTWLPHLATNTLSLLLPDIYRMLIRRKRGGGTAAPDQPVSLSGEIVELIGATLSIMLCDRPSYVLYVAPLAFGYLLSGPWLNIYKGALAEKRLFGFGLDALPHATTAFALTALVRDTARTIGDLSASTRLLGAYGNRIERYQVAISASALILATLAWELGEHRIYRYELARRGSLERINMQWSLADCAYDCAANAIGWLLATAWRANMPPRGGLSFSCGPLNPKAM